MSGQFSRPTRLRGESPSSFKGKLFGHVFVGWFD